MKDIVRQIRRLVRQAHRALRGGLDWTAYAIPSVDTLSWAAVYLARLAERVGNDARLARVAAAEWSNCTATYSY